MNNDTTDILQQILREEIEQKAAENAGYTVGIFAVAYNDGEAVTDFLDSEDEAWKAAVESAKDNLDPEEWARLLAEAEKEVLNA